MTIYYQQGDVLLFKTDKKIEWLITTSVTQCHKGDNHSHDFRTSVLKCEHEGKEYFLLNKDTHLDHFEHNTILIPKGMYEKRIVREYDHFLEEARSVID